MEMGVAPEELLLGTRGRGGEEQEEADPQKERTAHETPRRPGHRPAYDSSSWTGGGS